ncbi:MAG: hypothetical protein O3A46_17025 [Candidatus Poribacteria bacterium]|nr:hypothetical protein [Candidatus Poribacteria bacterium]
MRRLMTYLVYFVVAVTPIVSVNRAFARESGERIVWAMSLPGEPKMLYVTDDNGDPVTSIHVSFHDSSRPRWSPTGNYIVLATEPLGLAVVDADGSNLRQIGDMDGFYRYPTWSNDGMRVAVVVTIAVDPHGQQDIVVIDLATNESRLITDDRDNETWVDWSPTGGSLVYTTEEDIGGGRRQTEMYLIAVEGGQRRKIGNSPFYRTPVWSPDGARIGYVGEGGLRVLDVASGHETLVYENIDSLQNVVWLSGNRLAALAPWAIPYTIMIDIDGNEIRRIAEPRIGADASFHSFDWFDPLLSVDASTSYQTTWGSLKQPTNTFR